jgi:hypothetical protein
MDDPVAQTGAIIAEDNNSETRQGDFAAATSCSVAAR